MSYDMFLLSVSGCFHRVSRLWSAVHPPDTPSDWVHKGPLYRYSRVYVESIWNFVSNGSVLIEIEENTFRVDHWLGLASPFDFPLFNGDSFHQLILVDFRGLCCETYNTSFHLNWTGNIKLYRSFYFEKTSDKSKNLGNLTSDGRRRKKKEERSVCIVVDSGRNHVDVTFPTIREIRRRPGYVIYSQWQ